MPKKLTEAEIEAGRTKKGGFTNETFRAWGVPIPPPKGWKKRLMSGQGFADVKREQNIVRHYAETKPASDERPAPTCAADFTNEDLHKLLRKLNMELITRGLMHVMYEHPEAMAYFGLPTIEEVDANLAASGMVRDSARLPL